MLNRRRMIAAAAAGAALAAVPARAAGDLVIDGETIASADLLAAARAERMLSLYSVYLPDSMAPVLAAFKADTGLEVSYLRLPSQNMFPRVTAEYGAGKLGADYVDLTDLLQVGQLVKLGILAAPYKVRGFDAIPPALRDPDGRWYTLFRAVWVVGVNTAVVPAADAPKGWKALMDPRWAGRLGLTSAEAGGSSYVLYAFLRDVVDPGAYARLGAEKPKIYPSVSPLVTNLVRGEVAVAPIDATSIVSQQATGAPLAGSFAPEGTPAFPISGGIANGARHPNAARLWLEWLTSKRGGDVVGGTGSYGLNPAAAVPKAPGFAFPAVDKLWNVDLAHWVDTEGSYIADWKKAMGVS